MNSTLEQRIQTFVQLGQALQHFSTKQEWPGYTCGLTEEEFNGVNDVIESAVGSRLPMFVKPFRRGRMS